MIPRRQRLFDPIAHRLRELRVPETVVAKHVQRLKVLREERLEAERNRSEPFRRDPGVGKARASHRPRHEDQKDTPVTTDGHTRADTAGAFSLPKARFVATRMVGMAGRGLGPEGDRVR